MNPRAAQLRRKNGPAEAGQSSTDALQSYRDKRDPGHTTEPFERAAAGPGGATRAGRFVVHQHDATRMHWDLRLQVGSVLASFALPKGPSLDPKQRRLAVHTEDHPLEYLAFEDIIPSGNYGAGPMIAWDWGRVRYLGTSAQAGLAEGKLELDLAGFKLRGRFVLVRSARADNEWLLIKKQDAFCSDADLIADQPRSVFSGLWVSELAERALIAVELERKACAAGAPAAKPLATPMVPMLCASSGAELCDPDRLYELKLDGVRILAHKSELVHLRYRHGCSATESYPEVVRAVGSLPADQFILDGEIVAFDETGRPNFQRLGPRIHALRPIDIQRASADIPVVYVVFDLVQLQNRDLCHVPLIERKALLQQLVRGQGLVRVLDHLVGDGRPLYELSVRHQLEGVVAKRIASPYRPGPRRSEDWVKIKCEREDDFVVVGMAQGRGGRSRLGALLVGSYQGGQLLYRGKVGSGFDRHTIEQVLKAAHALAIEEVPTTPPPPRETGPVQALAPKLVARVRYMGWSDEGRLWHPVFRGLRDDIDPTTCTAAPRDEQLDTLLDQAAAEQAPPSRHRVHITNRSKVFWHDLGLTKGDLIDYYAAVADRMLPFLRDRPVVLVRYPDGIEGKSFFQWNAPAGTPSWMRTLTFRDEEEKRTKNAFLIDDADGLLHVANLGCIPIHVMAFRARDMEACDFLTIDFDLGPQPFASAVKLALELRSLLQHMGLQGFAKTSGQTGLHVLVPLGPGVGFRTARMLADLLALVLERRFPDIATTERRIAARRGRLYIDTGQTGPFRTIVAPYSVRAHPGATVSATLAWDEVHAALDPRRFTMKQMIERLETVPDPWHGFLDARPDVQQAVSRLGEVLHVGEGATGRT